MSSIIIIAAGKNKTASPFYQLWSQYEKRMQWKVTLHEVEAKSPKDELQKLKNKINPSFPLIALDEKGKNISSIELSKEIEKLQLDGISNIQFIIGGADGLDNEIRNQTKLTLSFGKLTWPHMMARCMLLEQIYRAQQILNSHPYHRE